MDIPMLDKCPNYNLYISGYVISFPSPHVLSPCKFHVRLQVLRLYLPTPGM